MIKSRLTVFVFCLFVLSFLLAPSPARTVKTQGATVGFVGIQSGTLNKYSRPFDYEKLAPRVYKVTPRVDLDDGEYGLFYSGSTPIGGYGYFGSSRSPKIFDFGIKRARFSHES